MNVAFRKVAPALVAGNCAILKPSEIAGLSCMFIGKLAQDAGIPAGVFSVVTGDRPFCLHDLFHRLVING